MFRLLRWVMGQPVTTQHTDEVQRLTIREIDSALKHWANKLHTDPDPLNRWATLNTVDQWLDCRNRAAQLQETQNVEV